jgi:hypothetical protein
VLGLLGCLGLFIFDRFCPIRRLETEPDTAANPEVDLDEGSVAEP